MEPLVEVNNVTEMGAALDLGAKLVGVNNRSPHDFTVDMGTTSRLADMVAGCGVLLCALSGIGSPADVAQYAAQGIHAVLVGESLMRAPDTAVFIRTLLGWPAPPRPRPRPRPRTALVKICGARSVADAHAAVDAGADMLGLMFVPSSKRRVDVGTPAEISLAMRTRRVKAAHPPAEDEDAAEPPNTP
jgi:anthranilate synthase/indole-3-glycerol phosphate synthase/phosphoribosylanthranilate isomerase